MGFRWLYLLALVALVAAVSGRHHGRHESEEHHDSSSSSSSSSSSESHHDDDDHHDSDEDDHDDDDIWYFQIGDNFGAYEFLDANDGTLKGFHVDLLHEVCKHAKKRCHYIVDNYENCWQTHGGHEYPGVGLLDEYYDGCLGLYPTVERKNSFNFTEPYTTSLRAVLVFRQGELPADKNIAGKTIGFVSGWAVSRACLARQAAFNGNKPGQYQSVFLADHDHLVAALKNKEVDAILTAEHVISSSKENFEKLKPSFGCTEGGLSVMARYGSELITWWNRAFHHMIDSGDFRKLCVKGEDAYGSHGSINCLL